MTTAQDPGGVCIEVFVPLHDPDGDPFPPEMLGRVKTRLADLYGGVTAYSRSPADGLWNGPEGKARDQMLVLEVMAPRLDRRLWTRIKTELEAQFKQDEILIRCHRIERI